MQKIINPKNKDTSNVVKINQAKKARIQKSRKKEAKVEVIFCHGIDTIKCRVESNNIQISLPIFSEVTINDDLIAIGASLKKDSVSRETLFDRQTKSSDERSMRYNDPTSKFWFLDPRFLK